MLRSANSVWIVLRGTDALVNALMWTVAPIYFVTAVRMNPLQLVLVGTVMEVAYFLSEVPTGAMADTYSRKLSVVAGTLLTSAAVLVVGLVPDVVVILCAWAVWGIGAAFVEGAQEAWLADEIGQDRLTKAFFVGGRAAFAAGIVGIAGSVALATVDLRLPIVVAGIIGLALGLWLIAAMPEAGHVPAARDARSWRAVGHTAIGALRLVAGRPLLLTLLAISAFTGMWSEGIDRLWQAHVIELGIPAFGNLEPIVWFGVIGIAGSVVGYVAYDLAERRLNLVGPLAAARALLVLGVIMAGSTIGFALADTFAVAVGCFLVLGAARSLQGPIWMTWLNRSIDDSTRRATVISIMGQGDALGQFAGGPGIGAVSTIASLRAGLTIAGAALVPAVGLYADAIRRGGSEAVFDELEGEDATNPVA